MRIIIMFVLVIIISGCSDSNKEPLEHGCFEFTDLDTFVCSKSTSRWGRVGDTVVVKMWYGMGVKGIQEWLVANLGGHIHSWDCKDTFPLKYCTCLSCLADTTFTTQKGKR